jgi:uncharacterized lipoprotein YmbA
MKIERITLVVPAVICFLLFAGCASTQQAKMYVLHSPEMAMNRMALDKDLQNGSIVLGRIRLPKHLDRPAILTQVSDSELAYSEFHRWAGPLDADITRVISLNLSQLTGCKNVLGYRATKATEDSYRVYISILSMTGSLGEEASLTARWKVSKGRDDKSAAISTTTYNSKLKSDDYATYVSAQSQLLVSLSRDIDKALRAKAK